MKISKSVNPPKGDKKKSTNNEVKIVEVRGRSSAVTLAASIMKSGKFKTLASSIQKPSAASSVSRSIAKAAVKSVLNKNIKIEEKKPSKPSIKASAKNKKI